MGSTWEVHGKYMGKVPQSMYMYTMGLKYTVEPLYNGHLWE